MERLSAMWEDVRSSLWFRPAALTLSAILLAFAALGLDRSLVDRGVELPAWLGGDPASAREVLTTIASGMITIAAMSFSVVIIALTLASNQFAPRVLRNFTTDRINQTTLGVFVGTFVYSLLVLRAIQEGSDGPGRVPEIAILTAMAAAVASLGFFIYFIHHIATGIQVSRIIENVAEETRVSIDRLLASEHGVTGPARIRSAPLPVPDGWRVGAAGEGYVDRIDASRLVTAAKEADLVLDVLVGPGDFVAEGSPLAVADRRPEDPEPVAEAVEGAFLLARQRTIHEDPAFGFRELVDIAVKAISPAMNDPNTAVNCVDYLGSFLRRMADRDWPPGAWTDEDGTLRARLPDAGFEEYVALAFTEVRRYGRADLAITLRILDALGGAADATPRPDRRAALWEEAKRVMETADRGIAGRDERRTVSDRFALLAESLGRDPEPFRLRDPTRADDVPSDPLARE